MADHGETAMATVSGFFGALASEAATPGGGAAAAVTAAAAAGLVAMVCRLTLGKRRFASHERQTAVVLARADALWRACLADADADATAYGAVASALKLPRLDPVQVTERQEQLHRALLDAAIVPAGLADHCSEISELAATLVGASNPSVASDLVVALVLSSAALGSAVVNVEINLGQLPEDPAVTALRERVAMAHARLERARREALGRFPEATFVMPLRRAATDLGA